jgi:hypothetical protein
MANTIGTLDVSVGGCFNMIGELVVFDSLTDAAYETAKISTFANAMKVRPLYNGTATWTGDEPEITQIKDEDGNVECSFAEGGTNSFEAVCIRLNKALTTKFLNGLAITDASLSSSTWLTSSDIIGVDGNFYVSYMPVAVFDKKKTTCIVFPKCQVTASLVNQDNGVGLKLSFEAQAISTANLKQLMIVRTATPNYTA